MYLCNCTANSKRKTKKTTNVLSNGKYQVDAIVRETYELLDIDNYDEIRFKYFPRGLSYFNLPLNNVRITKNSQNGFTLFLLAVFEERINLIELLLSEEERKKGMVMHRDIYGNNALHIAAYGKNKELVKLLIDSGVDTNATNKVFKALNLQENETPSMIVQRINNTELMDVFLEPTTDNEEVVVNNRAEGEVLNMPNQELSADSILIEIPEEIPQQDTCRSNFIKDFGLSVMYQSKLQPNKFILSKGYLCN